MLTGFTDSLSNIFSYGWSAGSSYYVTATLGIPGLVIDLVALAGSVIAGDSFSIRLKNCMSNDLSIAMGSVISNKLNLGKMKKDANGNISVVVTWEDTSLLVKKMWLANIFSKQWCEKKYLGYLEDDDWFMDDGFFLYKSPNSKENAKDNISKLGDLYVKYSNFPHH